MGTSSFTTTGRSLMRSRTDSKSDFQRNHQNGDRNKSNLLMGRQYKRTGAVAASTIQIISTTSPATGVLVRGSLENF